VYYYVPTTTVFKDTWQDADQGILNTNPVELDSAGRANIWGSGPYRQVVTDSLGNLVWDKFITLDTAFECGPVLYAGISSAEDEVPNPNRQQVQFQFCDMSVGPDAVPQNNTMVTFVAGLTNTGAFRLWIVPLNGGDPFDPLGYEILKYSSGGMIALTAGDITTGNLYLLMFNEGFGAFQLMNLLPTTAITDHSITNAKLAQVTGPVLKGRNLGSLGDVLDLTPTQATAILDTMVGDSGAGGTTGMVPAPAAGDSAAGRFLKADGSWAVPPGGGGGGGGAPDTATYFLASPDGALANARTPTDTATVSWDLATGGAFKANVVANSIGSGQLAQISTSHFLGRTTAGTGNVEELTGTQATALLVGMVGDSGAGGTKGLVPAPAAGDAAAAKFLKADGSWAAPSGSGAPSSAEYVVKSLDGGLSAERVLTDNSSILWDWATGSQVAGKAVETWGIAFSDEATAITTGTSKATFMWPFAVTIVAVYAGLGVAQASGSIFTVDVNEAGTTILSTKLTIDNTETTSTTAVTPPVISDSSIAAGALMSIDVDQVGDGTAKGGKVYIAWYRT
jgi:hypothetical protein